MTAVGSREFVPGPRAESENSQDSVHLPIGMAHCVYRASPLVRSKNLPHSPK